MFFLSFDELPDNERPPRRIWTDGEKLNDWFARVKRNREDEMKGHAIEDPVENELAAEMLAANG